MMTEQIIFEAPQIGKVADRMKAAIPTEGETGVLRLREEGIKNLAEARRAKRGQQYFRQMGVAA